MKQLIEPETTGTGGIAHTTDFFDGLADRIDGTHEPETEPATIGTGGIAHTTDFFDGLADRIDGTHEPDTTVRTTTPQTAD